MKKTIILALMTVLILNASAQKTIHYDINVSQADSLKLNNTWINFYQSIINKDSVKLKEIALGIVECPQCVDQDSFIYEKYFIPIDTFIKNVFSDNSLFDSHVWNAIKNKHYILMARRIPNFKPSNFELKEGEQYEDFEIFYVTREPSEWGKGHEGQQYYFTFVKINDVFKFSGTGTIP